MRVVLGVGGGIAAFKVVSVARRLAECGHEVRAVPTARALDFVGAATWEAITGAPVHTSVFDDVEHVEHVALGRWAELVAIAPATADLIARLRIGRADDLLTATALTTRAPIVVFPAMHTEMWTHPATQDNVEVLRTRGVRVVNPASGRLTGPDSGPGRMPEADEIAAHLAGYEGAADRPSLRGRTVVITAGGTREPLDPVRFLGNRSSGRQAQALAAAALARGAHVTYIEAASEVAAPAGVNLVQVATALELRDAVQAAAQSADVVVMSAAVADYRPSATADHKLKKSGEAGMTLELSQNPDILVELAHHRPRPGLVVVGFAAETGDGEHSAREHAVAKAERKGADITVFNDVAGGGVFGAENTSVELLTSAGESLGAVAGSKLEVSHAVWDAVAARLD